VCSVKSSTLSERRSARSVARGVPPRPTRRWSGCGSSDGPVVNRCGFGSGRGGVTAPATPEVSASPRGSGSATDTSMKRAGGDIEKSAGDRSRAPAMAAMWNAIDAINAVRVATPGRLAPSGSILTNFDSIATPRRAATRSAGWRFRSSHARNDRRSRRAIRRASRPCAPRKPVRWVSHVSVQERGMGCRFPRARDLREPTARRPG